MYPFSGLPAALAGRPRPDEFPLVRVTGEGRVEVAPDMAEISLGVTARAEQAEAAYQETAAVLSRIVQALLDLGIPREQIQSEQIALNPVYEEERIVGYEGVTTLRVTLKDLAAAGLVIDRAITVGANTVRGLQFQLSDPGAAEGAALAKAVQDARSKAMVLARSLGVQLGPVWRAEAEPSPGPVFPVAARAVAMEAVPVLPGTLSVVRQVRVEYMLQYR